MLSRKPSVGQHVASSLAGACAFLAYVADRAAGRCRLLVVGALRWPPLPVSTRWNSQARAQEQVSALHWVLAWPGMVIVCRLLYLGLALCIILGEVSINLVRAPAVFGLPSGGGGAPGASLEVATALLFLAMAAFFGALALECWNLVPTNVQLFPCLPARVERAFKLIALSGFGVSVITIALLYGAGAALLQGASWPALSILINLLQGIALTVAAVPALWALVLGLLSVFALVCLGLWLVCSALALVCHFFAGEAPHQDDPPFSALRLVQDENQRTEG